MKILEEITYNKRRYYIVKTKYGNCRVYKNDYKGGHRPTINSAINKNTYFENKAKEVHGNRYDYSKVIYKGCEHKVIIICDIHGEFKQTPHNHLKGNNCEKCGRIQSSNNRITHSKGLNKGIVYCLKIKDLDNKYFYKIGFTKHSIEYRYSYFKKSKMPYENYEILWQKVLNLEKAKFLENRYHKLLGEYHYKPKINFAGSKTECFRVLD